MAKEMEHPVRDIEKNVLDEAHLNNTTIRSLAWHGIDVEKRGWSDARPTPIISKIDGYAEAGILESAFGNETQAELDQVHSPP